MKMFGKLFMTLQSACYLFLYSTAGFAQSKVGVKVVNSFGAGCKDKSSIYVTIQDDDIIDLFFNDTLVKAPHRNVANDNHLVGKKHEDSNVNVKFCSLELLIYVQPSQRELIITKFNPKVGFIGDIVMSESTNAYMSVRLDELRGIGDRVQERPRYTGTQTWIGPLPHRYESFILSSKNFEDNELINDKVLTINLELFVKVEQSGNVLGQSVLLNSNDAQIRLGLEFDYE